MWKWFAVEILSRIQEALHIVHDNYDVLTFGSVLHWKEHMIYMNIRRPRPESARDYNTPRCFWNKELELKIIQLWASTDVLSGMHDFQLQV